MFRVIVLPSALKDLSVLDKKTAQRIADKLVWLGENIGVVAPVPLKGNFSGLYKLKLGDWRVIYDVNNAEKTIAVHKIGHRREIYK